MNLFSFLVLIFRHQRRKFSFQRMKRDLEKLAGRLEEAEKLYAATSEEERNSGHYNTLHSTLTTCRFHINRLTLQFDREEREISENEEFLSSWRL